jgi:predicted ATPase
LKITRIEIEAFRSLYAVTLELGDFSALVGANNAGKTNLADALQFLGEVARHGLEVALSRKGGYENVAFRRQRRTKRPVRFAVTMTVESSEVRWWQQRRSGNYRIHYEFGLRASSESREADYAVATERFTVHRLTKTGRPSGRPLFDLRRNGNDITIEPAPERTRPPRPSSATRDLLEPLTDAGFTDTYLRKRVSATDLLADQIGFSAIGQTTFASLAATRLYQLSPVECRKSGSPTPNPELDVHGANLPAVVRYIQRNHAEAWSATLDSMRRIVPGLEAIETDFTHDRRLALQFVERGAGRPWSSAEVSDGTIQSLALFTALFDPRVPLVLIEEPENSVHPWIVRAFVDACRAVPNKRVLVTTHSPALIAYLKPDELTVVWRRAGRTEIMPLSELDPQAMELWQTGEVNTFDIVDQGFLRETVPEGFA